MRQLVVMGSAILVVVIYACNGNQDANPKSGNAAETEMKGTSKAKFKPFNNVEDIRVKLSAVGIGELSRWQADGMGSYRSITPYYQIGTGVPPNTIACYLQSNDSSFIQTLKIVLTINNSDRKSARSKLGTVIGKTYEALGMEADTKIISELKWGKELSAEAETYRAGTKVETSPVETWTFLFQTK